MKNIETIKKDLKRIQSNFNPQKSTYKIIEELTTKNYNIDQMINILSKIRGINKYPIEVKKEFFEVLYNLKQLKKSEVENKEIERKLLEKKKQEANTKELKDIIDTLEKELNKKNRPKKEDNTQDKEIKSNNSVKITPKAKQPKKIEPNTNQNSKPLIISIFITIGIIVLIILFY